MEQYFDRGDLHMLIERNTPIIATCCLVFMATLFLLPTLAHAQTDTIHGVINRYAKVLFMCNGAFVVDNPYGFKRGDKVLIIQMKGAVIDTADTSSFGDILSYGNAGNYELAELDQVNGTTLVPKHHLVRTYDVPGLVQIVRVPTYANVVVSDTLTAKAWDGNTGGVLALIATGTLTLNADIDVTGKGFRGNSNDTNSSVVGAQRYWYPGSTDSANLKGEGIVVVPESRIAGRGKAANAGGGGNSRSSGGAGGGNYGAGGRGGYQGSYLSSDSIGGVGGVALTYSNIIQRVYLGGAGGAGGLEDQNPPVSGSAGGGLVLIRAAELKGGSKRIQAVGAAGTYAINDVNYFGGGGGGGAGGCVLLDVDVFSDTVTIDVQGGKGCNTQQTANCTGPGGGGGGGIAWFSLTARPGNVVCSDGGGPCGTVSRVAAPCSAGNYGALAGSSGGQLTQLQIPQGTVTRIP